MAKHNLDKLQLILNAMTITITMTIYSNGANCYCRNHHIVYLMITVITMCT